MAIREHLTIRDYIEGPATDRRENRKATASERTTSSEQNIFSLILSSFKKSGHRTVNSRPEGLTLADYRNNPVDARFPKRFPNKLISASIDENKDDDRPLSAAAKSSDGMNTLLLQKNKDRPHEPAAQNGTKNIPVNLPEKKIIDNCIHNASAKYRLPSALIKAVIRAESNFEAKAVSSAGAQGLMQLMPGTAKELGVTNPFDIEQNIDGGACYLRRMLDRFDGDLKKALAAYNAGPGTVEKYGGNVPYQETRRYVDRVIKFIGRMG